MMKSVSFKCVCFLAASTFYLSIANAATTSFTNKGLDFSINDDDPFAATITFDDEVFNLLLPGASSSTKSISDGVIFQPFPAPPLEIFNDFTFTVTPTDLSITDFTAIGYSTGIAPNNSAFNGGLWGIDVSSFTLSGEWSIAGPTETIIGAFDFTISPYISASPQGLNASQFPNAVTLGSALILEGTAEVFLVSAVVDGEELFFSILPRFLADSNSGVKLNVAASPVIPIPPAIWLFGSAIAGLTFARRKTH